MLQKNNKTLKKYSINNMPDDSKQIAWYKKERLVLWGAVIIMSLFVMSAIYSQIIFNKEILKSLKERVFLVLDGDDVKVVRGGYKAFKIVSRFVNRSLKDILEYDDENYQDAMRAARMYCERDLADRHTAVIDSEVESLQNLGGSYRIKFLKTPSVRRGKEDGLWTVTVVFNRIYKNRINGREVVKTKASLTVLDTYVNSVSGADNDDGTKAESETSKNDIDMKIVKMDFQTNGI